jgi:hypothetical protein
MTGDIQTDRRLCCDSAVLAEHRASCPLYPQPVAWPNLDEQPPPTVGQSIGALFAALATPRQQPRGWYSDERGRILSTRSFSYGDHDHPPLFVEAALEHIAAAVGREAVRTIDLFVEKQARETCRYCGCLGYHAIGCVTTTRSTLEYLR